MMKGRLNRNESYRSLMDVSSQIMAKLKLGVVKRMISITKKFITFLDEDIDAHKKDLDRDSPRDYVDHYLIAQEKDEDFSRKFVVGKTSLI